MQKPPFRMQLFWDTDVSQLDFEKHANAIIVRVPERGSPEDWHTIKQYYGHEKKEAALQARYLSKKVHSFISSLYNILKTKFRCYAWRQSNPVLWEVGKNYCRMIF